MVKTVSLTLYLALLLLVSCGKTLQPATTKSTFYKISHSDTLNPDPVILNAIQPFRDSMNGRMNEVLVYSRAPLSKGLPESPLGNLVADACQAAAVKACKEKNLPLPDFTMLNNGGLRSSLPQGNITLGNIFELMPFENELVIMDLNNQDLDLVMNYIARRKGNPVSGIKLELKDTLAGEVLVNGKNISSGEHYRLVTSDYLANGGDNLDFLQNLPRVSLGIKVRDAIIGHLLEAGLHGDTLNYKTDGRIYR